MVKLKNMKNDAAKNLKLISDYKNNDIFRSNFNKLAGLVFGIDFEPWYRAGFWNDRYICCSYANGNEVVSNVSVNMMELVVDGGLKKAVQIGTVMTHPDYRKKGLSAELMNFALAEYGAGADLIYLFANESAAGFYPAFGFEEIRETSFELIPALNDNNNAGLKKLDIAGHKDFSILKRLAFNRAPASKKLGVINDSHLIMFYCINYYTDNIYYSENLDTVVIYVIENGSLYLYDILSENDSAANNIALLNSLREAMSASGAAQIVFMFTPDIIAPGVKGFYNQRDYKLFIKPGTCKITGEFNFSRLSHA